MFLKSASLVIADGPEGSGDVLGIPQEDSATPLGLFRVRPGGPLRHVGCCREASLWSWGGFGDSVNSAGKGLNQILGFSLRTMLPLVFAHSTVLRRLVLQG